MDETQAAQRPERWSIARWRELEKLGRLLRDCESLNSGNCVIERMQRLIKGAKKLTNWNHGSERSSFIRFLQEQARHDYASRRKRKKPKQEPAT